MDTEQKARKRFQLAQQLQDSWKLVASLRYYHAHLIPGKWVELNPARREASRRLNPEWNHYYLKASRRLLGIVSRCVRDSSGNILRDSRDRKRIKYYLRRDVWEAIQTRLIFLNESAKSLEQDTSFDAKLFNLAIEHRFKNLPAGFRLSPEVQELSDELPLLIERTRSFLLKDLDSLTREMFAAEAERNHQRSHRERQPAPAKPPTTPAEVTVKAFARNVLRKLSVGSIGPDL